MDPAIRDVAVFGRTTYNLQGCSPSTRCSEQVKELGSWLELGSVGADEAPDIVEPSRGQVSAPDPHL